MIQKLVKRRKRQDQRVSRKKIIATDSAQKRNVTKKMSFFFLGIIRMTEETLKFDNIRVNKKEFHISKQPIDLDLVNIDQIVVFDKFKQSDDGFKFFIGYKDGEIVKPLCIILPQMSGCMKSFENGGKNLFFMIKDDMCLNIYNEIWDKIKETLIIKLNRAPVYDEKYIKAKVK